MPAELRGSELHDIGALLEFRAKGYISPLERRWNDLGTQHNRVEVLIPPEVTLLSFEQGQLIADAIAYAFSAVLGIDCRVQVRSCHE